MTSLHSIASTHNLQSIAVPLPVSVHYDTHDAVTPRGTMRSIDMPNGGTLLVCSDPSSRTACASVIVGIGGQSDAQDSLGLAHVLEHMAFLTPDGKPGPVWSLGFLGCSSNAMTDATSTRYYTETDPANLMHVLDVQLLATHPTHLMSHSTEVIQKEVRAVKDEIHMRGGGTTALYYAAQRHACGSNSVGGVNESQNNINSQNVRDFVERGYKPGNTTVFVVGNIGDHFDAICQRTREHFDSWPFTGADVHTVQPLHTRLSKTTDLSFLHSDTPDTTYAMAYRVPGTSEPEHYRDAVALEVIAGMLDMQRTSKNLGLSVSPCFERTRHPSGFLMMMGAGNVKPETVLHSMQETTEVVHGRVVNYYGKFAMPFQLDNMKASIQTDYRRRMSTNMGMVNIVADSIGRGAWNEYTNFLATVNSLEPADIRGAVKRWLARGPVARIVHSPMVAPMTSDPLACDERSANAAPLPFRFESGKRDVVIHGSAELTGMGVWKHAIAKNVINAMKQNCEDDCMDVDVSFDGDSMHLTATVPEDVVGAATSFLTTAVRGVVDKESVVQGIQQHCYAQMRELQHVRTSGTAMLRHHVFQAEPGHQTYFMTPHEVSEASNKDVPDLPGNLRMRWTVHGDDVDACVRLQDELTRRAQIPPNVLDPCRMDGSLRKQMQQMHEQQRGDRGIGQAMPECPPGVSPHGKLNISQAYDSPEFTSFGIAGGLRVQGIAPNSREHVLLGLGTRCLGGGFNGRLMQNLRSSEHLTYGAYAGYDCDNEMWSFTLTTAPEDLQRARDVTGDVLKNWIADPCTQTELDQWRRAWIGNIEMAMDDPATRTRDEHYDGRLQKRLALLRQPASVQEVRDVVRRHVSAANVQVVLVGPIQKLKT